MSTSRPTRNSEPAVFSIHGMALLVAACLIGGYLLVPRDRELMRRMITDGMTERAFHIMGVKNGSAAVLVERLIAGSTPDGAKQLVGDLKLLMPSISDPESVYRVICAKRQAFPAGVLQNLQDVLALRSLQLGNPKLAAKIYQDLASEGFLNWDQVRRAVAAARFTSQPERGIAFVTGHLERNHLDHSELPGDLRNALVDLNREINHGSQAFDLLAEEIKRHRDSPQLREIMDELAQVSIEANRFADAIPLIEGYLDLTAAGRMSWEELAKHRFEPRDSDKDFRKYAKLLGAYLEWHDRSAEAFDLYRKMALLGDSAALERCLTIYPWCSRENDLADLLACLHPILSRPDTGLLYARLEAQRAGFPAAEAILWDQLSARPGAADAWTELGHVFNEQGKFTEAIQAYERAFRLDPAGQTGAKISAAQLYVSLLRLDDGLKAYKSLPTAALTLKAAEDMATLAQTLSDGEAFELAQLQVLAKHRKPRAVDYLQVAGVWSSAGNLAKADEVMARGLEAYPDSDVLALARIDRLVEKRNLPGAFDLLAKVRKPGDFRYNNRLMTVALDLDRAGDALQLLRLTDPAAPDWQGKDRLVLADLYVQAGREDDAMRIYRAVPGGEAGQNRLQARKAFREGDFATAIGHQERYLALAEAPETTDWLFLGDLLKATGRLQDSERTYARLLAQLRARVATSELLALGLDE